MRMCLLLSIKDIGMSYDICFIPFCLQGFFSYPSYTRSCFGHLFPSFSLCVFFLFSPYFYLSYILFPYCTPYAVYSILCSFKFTSLSERIFFSFLSNSDYFLNAFLSFFTVSYCFDIISVVRFFQFCCTFVASIFLNFF